LALGCHFLYEGVWKIKHSHEFSAEGFLTQAKGPAAPLFYAMVPDIDGRQRLQGGTAAKGSTAPAADDIAAYWKSRWYGIRQNFLDYYRPSGSSDQAAIDAHKSLERASELTYDKFCKKLEQYLNDNLADISTHFAALDRFQNDPQRQQQAEFQKQRRWERMMELRREAGKWIMEIESQESAFRESLYSLLDSPQKERGLVPKSWNPLRWSQMEQINFAVTYGLTAIGVCLILGLCTPLAALGGAAFMCFVVLTQPAWPSIWPHDPEMLGHALLINKDFIEMLALLTVAAASAGRWGGLDFFLGRLLRRIFRRAPKKTTLPV
jgi:uncharacterized membrane protein YphA (DoxX/SURF4 family)